MMTTRRGFIAGVAVLVSMLAAAMIIGVVFGAEHVDPRTLLRDGTDRLIITDIRFPRVLVAALIGAILGMAGSTFQTLLRNPLADPFVLGVSGGAASAAAVAAIAGFSGVPGVLVTAAFIGACVATVGVFFLARRHRRVDTTKLLISGLVLNSFFSAVILLVLGRASGGDLSAALRWMMGSLSGSGWSEVWLLAVTLPIAFSALYFHSADLRLMSFGEEDARSRGVRVERLKVIGYFVASLATGAAVAVSGVIGFVGLLIPHLVRTIFTSDYRVQMPLSALAGAVLLVLADALARTIAAPAELPVGALLALLGVPFFIWILRTT